MLYPFPLLFSVSKVFDGFALFRTKVGKHRPKLYTWDLNYTLYETNIVCNFLIGYVKRHSETVNTNWELLIFVTLALQA